MELLVSCSNDEHQTSLKWNRSSHPVAPECRVSHTLHLKIFAINVAPFCVSCSLGLNVPADWHAGRNVRCKLSRRFHQDSNYLSLNWLIISFHVGVPYYFVLVKTYLNIYDDLKQSYFWFCSINICRFSEGYGTSCIMCVALNR